MNKEITLASGNVLCFQMASFSEGMKLFKVIANEIKQVDASFDMNNLKGLMAQEVKGDALNVMKNLVCQLIGSDALERALGPCMARCTYNGHAIKPDAFEPEEARGDYLPCAWEVIRGNVAPFFNGLNLQSLISKATEETSLK